MRLAAVAATNASYVQKQVYKGTYSPLIHITVKFEKGVDYEREVEEVFCQ